MTQEPNVGAPPATPGRTESIWELLIKSLQKQVSRNRFEVYVNLLSTCCACLMTVALGLLAVRAALRLETRWDTFSYHLPFAALRGGLHLPYEMNDAPGVRGFYEGFPPLPHLVQGMLWRMTGSVNATGVVNYLAFLFFLGFCHVKLNAHFWLVALIALTAPMVLIHTTVSYVDLFGNSFLAVGISTFVYMYLFDAHVDRSLLRLGMVGLIAAAWSKFQMVPLVAVFFVAFAVLFLVRTRRAGGRSGPVFTLILVAVLLASVPYLKNLAVHGNPFWPVRIPIVEKWVPYTMDLRTAPYSQQKPPPLVHLSQPALFFHSLLEINHPTSYEHRARWIIDQGNAWLAFRMGGFWNVGVVVFLTTTAVMALLFDRKKGISLVIGGVLLLGLVAVLPQSHELRYSLFLPLCWASTIGMLFSPLSQKYARSVGCCLLLFLGLFLYVSNINRTYYRIERVGYREAAQKWGADEWWKKLQSGVTYCVVDMAPTGILMTGPTMSEFHIIDRSDKRLCPQGAVVINKGVVERPMGLAPITKPAALTEEAVQADMMQVGLDLLYTKHDLEAAVTQFRQVLARNPTHYGATFQLAKALDQVGKPAEARLLWEKVLPMAEGYNDKQTADTARVRLGVAQ